MIIKEINIQTYINILKKYVTINFRLLTLASYSFRVFPM